MEPKADGYYWATAIYHPGHERRRVVLLTEWQPGTFAVWEPGDPQDRQIGDFTDWSGPLVDPKSEERR